MATSAGLSEFEDRRRRRLRARAVIFVFAVVCVLAALVIGLVELHSEGLTQFMYRAPGVGASTPAPRSDSGT